MAKITKKNNKQETPTTKSEIAKISYGDWKNFKSDFSQDSKTRFGEIIADDVDYNKEIFIYELSGKGDIDDTEITDEYFSKAILNADADATLTLQIRPSHDFENGRLKVKMRSARPSNTVLSREDSTYNFVKKEIVDFVAKNWGKRNKVYFISENQLVGSGVDQVIINQQVYILWNVGIDYDQTGKASIFNISMNRIGQGVFANKENQIVNIVLQLGSFQPTNCKKIRIIPSGKMDIDPDNFRVINDDTGQRENLIVNESYDNWIFTKNRIQVIGESIKITDQWLGEWLWAERVSRMINNLPQTMVSGTVRTNDLGNATDTGPPNYTSFSIEFGFPNYQYRGYKATAIYGGFAGDFRRHAQRWAMSGGGLGNNDDKKEAPMSAFGTVWERIGNTYTPRSWRSSNNVYQWDHYYRNTAGGINYLFYPQPRLSPDYEEGAEHGRTQKVNFMNSLVTIDGVEWDQTYANPLINATSGNNINEYSPNNEADKQYLVLTNCSMQERRGMATNINTGWEFISVKIWSNAIPTTRRDFPTPSRAQAGFEIPNNLYYNPQDILEHFDPTTRPLDIEFSSEIKIRQLTMSYVGGDFVMEFLDKDGNYCKGTDADGNVIDIPPRQQRSIQLKQSPLATREQIIYI